MNEAHIELTAPVREPRQQKKVQRYCDAMLHRKSFGPDALVEPCLHHVQLCSILAATVVQLVLQRDALLLVRC